MLRSNHIITVIVDRRRNHCGAYPMYIRHLIKKKNVFDVTKDVNLVLKYVRIENKCNSVS